MSARGAIRRHLAGLVLSALALANPNTAEALQRITVTDDTLIQIRVSNTDVNVITMPAPVLQAVTSKPDIDVKTQGRHVLVTSGKESGELVVITDQHVYVMQLKPAAIPAETILVVEQRQQDALSSDAALTRDATDYVDELTDLLKTAAQGGQPAGYAQEPVAESDRIDWVEMDVLRDTAWRGARLLVRIVEWRNTGASTLTLRESEFFTGRELAIALDRLTIEPGARVTAYLVYPADSPKAASGARLPLPPADAK